MDHEKEIEEAFNNWVHYMEPSDFKTQLLLDPTGRFKHVFRAAYTIGVFNARLEAEDLFEEDV